MKNYRSIRLLTVFSKAMEVTYNRFSHFIHTNNILLVPEQYGFRQGKSTDNAAFNLTNCVLKSLNQKMHVGGIFYDLAKA
jgi:hypothetical protein